MSIKQYLKKGDDKYLSGYEVSEEKAQELIEVIGIAWEITPDNPVEPMLQGTQADINFLLDCIDQLSRELTTTEKKNDDLRTKLEFLRAKMGWKS